MTKKILNKGILYVLGIFWTVICLFPLFFSLLSSFKTGTEIYGSAFSLPETFSFINYKTAIETSNMLRAVTNSFTFAIATTVVVALLGSMAAFVISRMNLRISGLILMYFLMGLTIPVHATLIPLAEIISKFNLRNNPIALIFVYVAINLPFAVFILTGFMKEISFELDEAATIDGCGPVRTLFQIIMPLAKPAIATAGIVTFLAAYNDLIFSTMFITEKKWNTIALALMSFKGSNSVDLGATFAAICISVLPMIIIYIVFQNNIESGLTAGSVKG